MPAGAAVRSGVFDPLRVMPAGGSAGAVPEAEPDDGRVVRREASKLITLRIIAAWSAKGKLV